MSNETIAEAVLYQRGSTRYVVTGLLGTEQVGIPRGAKWLGTSDFRPVAEVADWIDKMDKEASAEGLEFEVRTNFPTLLYSALASLAKEQRGSQ